MPFVPGKSIGLTHRGINPAWAAAFVQQPQAGVLVVISFIIFWCLAVLKGLLLWPTRDNETYSVEGNATVTFSNMFCIIISFPEDPEMESNISDAAGSAGACSQHERHAWWWYNTRGYARDPKHHHRFVLAKCLRNSHRWIFI